MLRVDFFAKRGWLIIGFMVGSLVYIVMKAVFSLDSVLAAWLSIMITGIYDAFVIIGTLENITNLLQEQDNVQAAPERRR